MNSIHCEGKYLEIPFGLAGRVDTVCDYEC